uniref:RNA polymerase subunit H/Rpb5 C-terminal domain-containing protein n=1 Tax=viral metagenome TaxID=1070528 RepID=A0A6C0FAH9_9ZZZZ
MLDLLGDQGYQINDYDGFTINEVNAMFQNKQLDMLVEKLEPAEGGDRKVKTYVRYYMGKTLRPQNIQEIIDDLFHLEEILKKEDTLIIINKDEINETLTNLVKHIWEQDGIYIVIINIRRLQFNILKNVLVPPHKVINDDKFAEVKRKFNIMENSQLPEISRFDPVAMAIGIRPGEVCEIIRPSKTSVTTKYYRICV